MNNNSFSIFCFSLTDILCLSEEKQTTDIWRMWILLECHTDALIGILARWIRLNMNIYLNTHSCKYYTFSCRRNKSFFHYISQAKWHWRRPCGIIEAKRENSFPFCDECPSEIYSGESASLVLLDNIHHHWQTTPDDTLAL